VDSARERVYVANFGSDSVSVIDSDSNTVIQTITAITSANGIAHDPVNNIIWVTNYDTDRVTPIQANGDATSFTVLSSLPVGNGPWGVAYVGGYVYVVNNLENSVTVIDAAPTPTIEGTLTGWFSQPYHVAANPNAGKVYVANFGNGTLTVINGTSVSSVVDLFSSQPYGVAVDEIRNVVYVATVSSHRVVAVDGQFDQYLGWAEFHRGWDPSRPVPMRVIAVNPDIGPISPMDDGGHVWTTTSAADGSEADQALLIPKGWISGFHSPVPCDVGTKPWHGIAINRELDQAYVTSGITPGTLSVFEDYSPPPLIYLSLDDQIGYEIFIAP
jgi:YVTN family beta-propeller protein